MSSRRQRNRIYLAILATLVLGFVVPPTVNLSHFRTLLSHSLSRSLDRQTSVEDVRLRLLPLPGFTFRHLHISDDDEFGGEPILQTQEDDGQSSVATLRLTSLWRGRLEIASVSLEQASLNLVRAADGHWNLERLINRAAQVPSAPTSKKKPEFRARFPYIELKDSRINFKFGPEKKPFTLSDAEFALWLAAENRWNVRLQAIPLRTDESISDTGVIRISGSFDRANAFAQTPFHFQAIWERPEVNAVLRIARGYDPGWRGVVELNAELRGTPADFSAHIDANVDEFRRYDIARTSSFNVHATCDQRFRASENGGVGHQLDFKCRLPLDSGAITANGKLQLGNSPALFVRVFAGEVPVATIVQAMLHAKSTLPGDLIGDGTVDGDWSIERTGSAPVKWQGTISATGVELHSSVLGPALMFPHLVRMNFDPPQPQQPRKSRVKVTGPGVTRASIEPFALDLGGDVQVSGSFDTQGYQMNMHGPVDWRRLLQASRAIGVSPPPTDLQGSGSINVQYVGEWRHFAPPNVTGDAQIDSATLSLRGFSEPLIVNAGVLSFDGPNFQAKKIVGRFARTGLEFVGSLSGTRQCDKHVICNVNFSLEMPELREKAVLALLWPQSSGLPLPFFNSERQFEAKWLLEVPASGTIAADQMIIGNLPAKNVSAQLQIGNGKIVVHHWFGDLFGGKHEGDWTFDFSGAQPRLEGVGSLRHAYIEQARDVFGERPTMGTFDLDYQVALQGASAEQLALSTTGSGVFSWDNGTVATAYPADSTTIHFGNWSGHFAVDKQRITLLNSRMDSPSGTQEVNGEISFSRLWNLQFVQATGSGVVPSRRVANTMGPTEVPSSTEARR